VEDFVDEREQWEQVQAWLRQNGLWIVAGIAVGAAVLWGWRFYQDRLENRALAANAAYEQILDAFGRGDRTHAMSLLAALERDHAGSPYVDQAHLAAARLDVEGNDLAGAASELRGVLAATHDPELALVARLRLARVELAQLKPDAALETLAAAPAGSAFAPDFAEVRGDALLAKGDRAGALKAYSEAYAAGSAAKTAGVLDTATLDLKMRDLAAAQPEPRP